MEAGVAKEWKPGNTRKTFPECSLACWFFLFKKLCCNVFLSPKREDSNSLWTSVPLCIVLRIYRAILKPESRGNIWYAFTGYNICLGGHLRDPCIGRLCFSPFFVSKSGFQQKRLKMPTGAGNVPALHCFQPIYGQSWCSWTFTKPRTPFSEFTPSLCLIELESVFSQRFFNRSHQVTGKMPTSDGVSAFQFLASVPIFQHGTSGREYVLNNSKNIMFLIETFVFHRLLRLKITEIDFDNEKKGIKE